MVPDKQPPAGNSKQGDVFLITVNGGEVQLTEKHVTGLQIKEAAIAQHVKIQPDFVLSKELENGGTKIIRDNEKVTLHQHDRFLAVPPDDNS